MRRQFSIAKTFLWLFVIALGIDDWCGLYKTSVVMPLWDTAPPDSVIVYQQHNAASPQFALNAGGRFWVFATPLVGFLAITTLVSGLRTRPKHRKWRTAGTFLTLIVVLFTFLWFVPNNIQLTGKGVMAMSPDEVTSLTNWWVRLNWVHEFLYFLN